MSDKLISAEEARANAEKFDLSSQQILDEISQSISANSQVGARKIIVDFRKDAASDSEVEKAIAAVREKGYEVETKALKDFVQVKVAW